MGQSIPSILHQTWKSTEVPEHWREFQESWRIHHASWEYRLWTDLELRQMICDDYPWFLPIYDNFPEQIQRVDAARYFLMHRYGGVYVDLDFEALRPLEPLLENKKVVLGYEPQEHFAKSVVKAEGFDRVACNAFLASSPQHPFWEHVFLEMIGSHLNPGPLASTGPLMLTRAVQSYRDPGTLTCLPSSLLYPGTSEDAKSGLLRDNDWRARNARNAYAIHHWSGSWIPRSPSSPTGSLQLPITLMKRGHLVMEGQWAIESRGDEASRVSGPMVSGLMVTSSRRLRFAKRAIACFQAQTYPDRELVILDDGDGSELARYVKNLNDPRLVYSRLPCENAPLGRLRNLAVSLASGTYVMQWDDDDLYHRTRIATQMSALHATGADVCLLARWKIWWPDQKRIATSKKRAWEGSLLCVKEKLPLYDETKRRGEDTPVVLRLASQEKVAILDAPWLYTYVIHGTNTTPRERLDDHWTQATDFRWGDGYASGLRALAATLPKSIRTELEAEAAQVDDLYLERKISSDKSVPALVMQTKNKTTADAPFPKILILSPVKNGTPFIEAYFSGLRGLSYPADRLSLALLESDSTDGTYKALVPQIEELKRTFASAKLFQRQYHFMTSGHRTNATLQLQRRSILARSRNYLLARALSDEDWVLWLDFDVIRYPPDLIERLLAKRREIVVPHCVIAPGGRTFDLNTFIRVPPSPLENPLGDDTLAQPPRGHGRKYLEEVRDRDLVEVDGVGGTVLLVKADLHREGLVFPVAPYKSHIETEGLSFLARDMGARSWGAPQIEVIHAEI